MYFENTMYIQKICLSLIMYVYIYIYYSIYGPKNEETNKKNSSEGEIGTPTTIDSCTPVPVMMEVGRGWKAVNSFWRYRQCNKTRGFFWGKNAYIYSVE